MKKALLVLLAIAVVGSMAFSEGKPNTRAGDKALLFTINGLGTFGVGGLVTHTWPVGGSGTDANNANVPAAAQVQTGFGMKYYIANNLALRGAFNIGITSRTQKQPTQNNVTPSDDKISSFSIGLTPGIQLHITQVGPVTAYLGGELGFGMISATHTFPANPGATPAEQKSSFTTFGLGAFLGAEFYPWDNISFGAEYKFGFSLQSGKTDVTQTANNATTTTTRDGPSVLNLGISAFAVTLGINF